MKKDFKPIKFEDLGLTTEEMKKIAAGARVFLAPDEPDEPEEGDEPLVTPRPKRDTV